MANPRITAIIPHYQDEGYVGTAVSAMVSQTAKPNLIFVIDDGSSRESYEKMVQAVRPGKRDGTEVRVIRKPGNSGRSATKNVGISETLGETDFYALCDSDDYYHPTKIRRSLDLMSKFPEIGLVTSDFDRLNVTTGEKERQWWPVYDYQNLMNENIVPTNGVVAAESIRRAGLFDEQLEVAEDYDLWLRIARHAAIHHIAEALFTYRFTGRNSDVTLSKDVWGRCLSRIRQKTMDFHQRGVTS